MKKPAEKKRKQRRGHHPNPARLGLLPSNFRIPEPLDAVADMAADVMIREALRGATTSEKLLVASLLPEFLKVVRIKPKPANENPNEAETNAGGKE